MYSSRRAGRSVRLGALLAALCLLAGGVASCGGDGDGASGDEQEIETAVRDLQRAFAAENAERVCALLSTAARKHVEGMGHGTEGPCYFDLFMFVEGVQKTPGWRDETTREIGDVVVDGKRATATVEFEDGQTANLPLVHERGRWRVDALWGGIPAGQQEDRY